MAGFCFRQTCIEEISRGLLSRGLLCELLASYHNQKDLLEENQYFAGYSYLTIYI